MTAQHVNQELAARYQSYLSALYQQQWPNEASAPLLMHVFDEYVRMPRKLLVVGQETHGWMEMNQTLTVQDLQGHYENFGLGKRAGDPPRYLSSPFWNFCRTLYERLNNYEPNVSRRTNGFQWTNLSKFDVNKTTPSLDIQQLNKEGFNLLRDEVRLLKPDVVVFLIGNKYNHWLNELSLQQANSGTDESWLSLLTDTTGVFPVLTFKTHHPRTLSYRGMYRPILDQLIKAITDAGSGPLT